LKQSKAKATIAIVAAASGSASFEIGDLAVSSVRVGGADVPFTASSSALHVSVPKDADASIVVEYQFKDHGKFDGWLSKRGVSFLWPKFCGNLFPCKSSPDEGLTFSLQLAGVDPGATAVYPSAIRFDAPSYMLGIAVAKLTKIDLGTTAGGTSVSVWHLPGQDKTAKTGTTSLVASFDFFEKTFGPYKFGKAVGSVEAAWGGGGYGGMEHHPYWHVASGSMSDAITHAHEAAHGWFGNGVRIRCWEDFVLSEGSATYLAARALAKAGTDVWANYGCQLHKVCSGGTNTIVLPDSSCNAIDIITHPLWSNAPYQKGAFFLREVGKVLGEDALDAALAGFYQQHVGKSARMQMLVDHLKAKSDAAGAAKIDKLAVDWLRTNKCPIDTAMLCK
jgi:aminopeptidase N